jgi:hypothetical protein
MGGMKKGIVFTVSILLLASAFLYLLSSISMYSDALRDANTNIIQLEKVNMQFDTESYGMGKLLREVMANVSWEGANVSFTGNYSSAGNGEYYAAVERFGQFTEAFGLVDSSINLSEARRPLMHMDPQNITIGHLPGKVGFYPEDSNGSAGEVHSYTILIRAGVPTPGITWGDYSEMEGPGDDAVYVHIGFEGNNGTVSDGKYLYKYNESEIMLVDRNNQSIVGIRLGSPAELEISYSADIYLKTIIELDTQGEVELGRGIIAIDGGDWGSKAGKVIAYDG